jgi:hypothetical protein
MIHSSRPVDTAAVEPYVPLVLCLFVLVQSKLSGVQDSLKAELQTLEQVGTERCGWFSVHYSALVLA